MFPILDVLKLLLFGTFSTTVLKTIFQYQVISPRGHQQSFNKSYFMVFMMFFSMMFAYLFEKKSEKPKSVNNRSRILFLLLTLFDISAAITSGLALSKSSVPASLYQLLGASLLVFTTINARLFLKRKQRPHQWISVFVIIFGLTCVGVSAQLDTPQQQSSELLIGIGLLLIAQLAWSLQFVVAEFLLKKLDSSPLQVVYYEGFFGSTIMMAIVLPLLQCLEGVDSGSVENSFETLHILLLNPILIVFLCIFVLIILFYNIIGQQVTKKLSSVHRTVLESLRSLGVWLVGLLFYYATNGSFGEPWMPHSWLKSLGFVVLVVGSLVYNCAPGFKLKGLCYK
ncbi:hypothetical protein RCL1_002724 [Eukaryota sp. TZLM3-RCL]